MRKLTIFAACLLTAAALTAGCGLFGDRGESKEKEKETTRLVDEAASFTVFLRSDANAQQQTAIEAQIRAIPGVKEVVHESKGEA